MPNENDEITFISGIANSGSVAVNSYWVWAANSSQNYNDNYSYASKWGSSLAVGTSGGTQYYYFDQNSHWNTTEQQGFVEGLSLWSAVANIQFAQTSNPSAASLTFVRGSTGTSDTEMRPPGESIGVTNLNTQVVSEKIVMDTSVSGWGHIGSFTDMGGYDMDSVVHEEGHFLGLGHGGAYNSNANASLQQYSPYDNRQWSIMSYFTPSDTTAKYYSSYLSQNTNWNGNVPTTWMPDDILAVQRLYGIATNTPLSGGQTFGFNCNIGGAIQSFFNFSINTNPVLTLYDTGNGNTLDLSGYSTAAIVDLRPGAFSSFDGMINNVAIAYGTKIDNYNGSGGNDYIMTNSDADSINGGGGVNQVIFSGTLAQYKVSQPAGVICVTNLATGITDRMINIQSLRFSDQILYAVNIENSSGPIHQNNTIYGNTSNISINSNLLNLQSSYSDLIQSFGSNISSIQGWYNTSQPNEHRISTFNGLNYVASYGSLILEFKSDVSMDAISQDGSKDFISSGYYAGRNINFNGLDYVASYSDLIPIIGSNNNEAAMHFIQSGYLEGRAISFDGLDYIASYHDLINIIGVNEQAGAAHYINLGHAEGREVTFDGLNYIASYQDLMRNFGVNKDAGSTHFITSGYTEGRSVSFDGLNYVASYSDLISTIGANNESGAMHFIQNGNAEGRVISFDGLDYIASYHDLIHALGTNNDAGATHFIENGHNEGRTVTFDGLSYIAQYKDLMNSLGASNNAGAIHYITNGLNEGRRTTFDTAGYMKSHPDLVGVYKTTDSFLSAYITKFETTGHFLT